MSNYALTWNAIAPEGGALCQPRPSGLSIDDFRFPIGRDGNRVSRSIGNRKSEIGNSRGLGCRSAALSGPRPLRPRRLLWLVLPLAISGCGQTAAPSGGTGPPAPTPYELELPRGFPGPIIPDDNPLTVEKIELGRFLFYDTRLSGNGTLACASCHLQENGFADPRTTSLGSTGEATARNAPGLANSAYHSTLTWSSRLLTQFEQQMLVPMFGEDPIELGLTGHEEPVLQRFREDDRYQQLFDAAYPGDAEAVNFDNIVKAIASFLRTMISGSSPFHRFTYQGDASALSDSARRGAELFFSERLECHHCHGGFHFTQASINEDSAFQENAFHNIGLYNVDGAGGYPPSDTGLAAFTGDPDDMGKFRAPSLQNVAVTAPYFHDGSAATLEDVLAVYEAGGRNIEEGPNAGDGRENPHKNGFIRGFTLTDQERTDVIAFLESLTDESFLSDPRLSNPFEEAP